MANIGAVTSYLYGLNRVIIQPDCSMSFISLLVSAGGSASLCWFLLAEQLPGVGGNRSRGRCSLTTFE